MGGNVNVLDGTVSGQVKVGGFRERERLLDVVGGIGNIQAQYTHLIFCQTSTDFEGISLY